MTMIVFYLVIGEAYVHTNFFRLRDYVVYF